MQITESKLRQNIQHLLKEEVYGKIATVYHGSKQGPEKFIELFENESGLVGWETGKGAGSMYGHGLYTVWTKTYHQTFKGGYGKWIYKFKVNLEGFIIFDETVCKQVYGASLTPLQQLEKLGKKQLINSFDVNAKKALSKPPAYKDRSADMAAKAAPYLSGNVNGVVFWGHNDGPVVIAYDPNMVTPMSYAKLENAKKDIWTRWKPDKIKNSLSRSAKGGTIADPERLQSSKPRIPDFNKLVNASDENLIKILERTPATDLDNAVIKNNKNKDFKRRILSLSSNIERLKHLVASSEETPPEILTKLADDDDKNIVMAVLSNKSCPNDIIEKLADSNEDSIRNAISFKENLPLEIILKFTNDDNPYIRSKAAMRTSVPPEVLTKMSNDNVYFVRGAVAENKSTPLEVLTKLAKDKDYRVRICLLDNPSITMQLWEKLSRDRNSTIRFRIAKNTSTPPELLIKLLDDKDIDVKTAVAYNPNLPHDMLAKMAVSDNARIRAAVAANENAPRELLIALLKDTEDNIRHWAKENLKKRGLQESLFRRVIRQLL